MNNIVKLRIWFLRICVVGIPLLVIVLVMKFLLPGLAKDRRYSLLGDNVLVYESKHFEVLSQKSLVSPQHIAAICEEYYESFVKTYGKQIRFQELETKISILFFSSREEFETYYMKESLSRIPHNAAFYSPAKKIIVMYMNNHKTETLYHELTHMILDFAVEAHSPDWSTWFNEGVASYFDQTKIENGKIIPGKLDELAVQYVQQEFSRGEFISLKNLCYATSANFRSAQNSIYYNESYLLVYFLMHADNGKYREAFFKYFAEEAKPFPCAPAIFWSTLNKSASELEKEFLEYYSID